MVERRMVSREPRAWKVSTWGGLPRSPMAAQMVPMGFSGVPPVGPAMPETAMP